MPIKKLIIVFAEENITELEIVSQREKFKKYFNPADVQDLLDFIKLIGEIHEINDIEEVCRDPKDDFLLSLAKISHAHYLITGDNDLLDLKEYYRTKIITIDQLERMLNFDFA